MRVSERSTIDFARSANNNQTDTRAEISAKEPKNSSKIYARLTTVVI